MVTQIKIFQIPSTVSPRFYSLFPPTEEKKIMYCLPTLENMTILISVIRIDFLALVPMFFGLQFCLG